MREFMTTHRKLMRAALLIAALLPLTALGNCPPQKKECQEGSNCGEHGSDSDSSGGGY
jgi:hypothetical protein